MCNATIGPVSTTTLAATVRFGDDRIGEQSFIGRKIRPAAVDRTDKRAS
jgi:hypothetical protein